MLKICTSARHFDSFIVTSRSGMSRYSPPEILPQLCRLDKNIPRNVASGARYPGEIAFHLGDRMECTRQAMIYWPKGKLIMLWTSLIPLWPSQNDVVLKKIPRLRKEAKDMPEKEGAI